jgi:two-component system, OmpR family, KDP operon response regulator KdpE
LSQFLIIDDDRILVDTCTVGLQALGHEVRSASSGSGGVASLTADPPDAVVLDLGLPDQDGLAVFRKIREHTDLPVVILSGDVSEDRKVTALDGGADDYMTKPVGIRELDARLRLALRRRGTTPPEVDSRVPEIVAGVLRLDTDDRTGWWRGVELTLTRKEFDFLACLTSHAGQTCSHQLLLEWVWGPEFADEHHYLKVYIYRLRKKLGDVDGSILRTEPSLGYRLVPPTS